MCRRLPFHPLRVPETPQHDKMTGGPNAILAMCGLYRVTGAASRCNAQHAVRVTLPLHHYHSPWRGSSTVCGTREPGMWLQMDRPAPDKAMPHPFIQFACNPAPLVSTSAYTRAPPTAKLSAVQRQRTPACYTCWSRRPRGTRAHCWSSALYVPTCLPAASPDEAGPRPLTVAPVSGGPWWSQAARAPEQTPLLSPTRVCRT